MEYVVGAGMALGVGLFTTIVGLDRDRALYPAILIVIAFYYDLFAVMAGGAALIPETGAIVVFLGAAVIGFRTNLWIVVVALVGHGVFDWYHGALIENAGVPAWWSMWCLSYDAAAGAYLAWRLLTGKIDATNPSSFGKRIHAYVEAELDATKAAERDGDPNKAFRHLERAHVLGQRSTVQHARVHVRMLTWALRHNHPREVTGQILRVIGAAAGTWAGLVPEGNTGGANISGFEAMPIPEDLASQITMARTSRANSH